MCGRLLAMLGPREWLKPGAAANRRCACRPTGRNDIATALAQLWQMSRRPHRACYHRLCAEYDDLPAFHMGRVKSHSRRVNADARSVVTRRFDRCQAGRVPRCRRTRPRPPSPERLPPPCRASTSCSQHFAPSTSRRCWSPPAISGRCGSRTCDWARPRSTAWSSRACRPACMPAAPSSRTCASCSSSGCRWIGGTTSGSGTTAAAKGWARSASGSASAISRCRRCATSTLLSRAPPSPTPA